MLIADEGVLHNCFRNYCPTGKYFIAFCLLCHLLKPTPYIFLKYAFAVCMNGKFHTNYFFINSQHLRKLKS